MAHQEGQVAVFIDYENIVLSFRSSKKGKRIKWPLIFETVVDVGRIGLRRAYADWSNFRDKQHEMLQHGVDLVHIPSKRGKNAADIRLVMDAMDLLLRSRPHYITHVLLVSGDGDFTELVHRLRVEGIQTIGLGIRGTSSDYLVKACDQFIYYDTLLEPDEEKQEPDKEEEAEEEKNTSPTLKEARQLLQRVLQRQEGEWISAGKLKSRMLLLEPAFSERNYRYSSFKQFLLDNKKIARTRTHEGGHLEVQMVGDEEPKKQVEPPKKGQADALLAQYLDHLSSKKVQMTPSADRPRIIFRMYNLAKRVNYSKSLTELHEELHKYFQTTEPQVEAQQVDEAVHQLFRTFCFQFNTEINYPKGALKWDQKVRLYEGLNKPVDLLQRCDRGLLEMIGDKLGGVEKMDRAVAARLLYGVKARPKMVEYVGELIGQIQEGMSYKS